MARPIKVRDKRTGEIIEFDWTDPTPPTRFDIDRIIEERKSKPIERPPQPEINTFTPRFPTANIDEIRERTQPDFRSEVIENYLPQPIRTFDEPLQPPTFKGEASKLWNRATTPLMPDVERDVFGAIDKGPLGDIIGPPIRFIGEGITSPLGMLTGGVGLNAIRHGGKMVNALRGGKKVLGALDELPVNKLDDITAPPQQIKQPYRISNIEGKRTIIPQPDITAGQPLSAELSKELGTLPARLSPKLEAKLPKELAGARPRYNVGGNSFEPSFDNDIDKALYIVAQDKPSKRNADYMQFVTENTGMSPEEAIAAGKQVRSQLGDVLKNQKLGSNNKIPRLYNPNDIDELPSMSALPDIQVDDLTRAKEIVKNYDGSTERLLDMTDEDIIDYAEAADPTFKPNRPAKTTGKTTAIVTGDEKVPLPPQAIEAAKTQTAAVPPSAQAEQSINEFVPKNMDEAMKMIQDAEKRLKAAGKSETFISHFTTQMWNFPKSTWATLDLSAPLRQGKGLIYTGEYWRSLDDMIKSGMSERGYIETMAKIKAKPMYQIMKKYDPGIIDLESSGKSLLKMEENRMSDWAENIPSLGSVFKGLKEWDIKHARTYVFDPENVGKGKEALGKVSWASRGVRASNRAYSGFLNTLRADKFENMVLNYEKTGLDPYNNPELLKATADFISTATGRSSLGNFEAAAETLNKYSFSIRFAKSRFDMGVLAPVKWRNAPLPVKKEVMKSLIGHALYTTTFTSMAHAAGAEVNVDPTSSDFGKVKIGDTRIDTLAGLQQPIVAVARMLSGLSTSPTTGQTTELGVGYRADTGIDVGVNFARTKLSPWTGLGWDVIKGRTISGKITKEELARIDLDNYFVKMFAPNLASTLIDLAQDDPKYLAQLGIPITNLLTSDGKPYPIPVILSRMGIIGASALGESVQVFDEPPPQSQRRRSLSGYSYEGRKK